jgi:hypothetical protein
VGRGCPPYGIFPQNVLITAEVKSILPAKKGLKTLLTLPIHTNETNNFNLILAIDSLTKALQIRLG